MVCPSGLASEGHAVNIHEIRPVLRSLLPGLLTAQLGRKRLSATRDACCDQRKAQIVLADIDEVRKSFDKAQNNKDICQRADSHTGVAFLEARDGARRRTRAHREISHGEATSQARAANVVTESFESELGLQRSHGNYPDMTVKRRFDVKYD
jgi:hypothetical protein